MANLNFNSGEWQIKHCSCPYQKYLKTTAGINVIAMFHLSPLPSKTFFDLSANNPVASSWNESDI